MRRVPAWLSAVVLALAGLAACTAPGDDDSSALVVETEQGKVKGINEEGIRAWRGIPYAAAPVEDLRWRPPQEHDDWDGVRSAAQYGHTCLQTNFPAPGQTGSLPLANSAEDCLFLNVNAPKEADDLPVMVWLHGGGFVGGTGGPSLANSPEMVKRGVVLVTLNYRLGRLGFFAHPSLEGDVANYGLLDQVAALEWVQDNIEGFGGDPDNVTIFGQSAGGMSVNALMTSPAADGLFDKAISQSGLGRERSISLDEARADGEQFLPGLDADALREIDANRLLGPPQDILAGDLPIVDEVLPMRVADAFAAGEEADVPYLTGTTNAEFPDSVFESLARPPDDGAVLARRQRSRHLPLLVRRGAGAPTARAQRLPLHRARALPRRPALGAGADVPLPLLDRLRRRSRRQSAARPTRPTRSSSSTTAWTTRSPTRSATTG